MILLRYNEVALEGLNRSVFERRLAANVIRKFFTETGIKPKISHVTGRLILDVPMGPSTSTILERTFGIVGFSPIIKVETSVSKITETAIDQMHEHCKRHGVPNSFYVRTRRSDKVLVDQAMDLDRKVGGAIRAVFPEIPVKIDRSSLMVGIELRKNESFVWIQKFPGPGGLPVGVNGRVLTLLSGGIDSPVAALRVMRRGVNTDLVHFHGTPFVGDEVLLKVQELARRVNQYAPRAQPLYVVPFGEIQESIAHKVDSKFRTIVYRRMMLRIAKTLAISRGASALVTGESIGQVASQTLENLSCVNDAVRFPILRPLVAYDKDEIMAEAKKMGTYEISIQEAIDCCTLFADRHPVLDARVSEIEEMESDLDIDGLIQKGQKLSYFLSQSGERKLLNNL